MTTTSTAHHEDPFNLTRFQVAQEGTYEQVLLELRSGKKRTHWMWFIFPQIAGLGRSSTSMLYAIESKEEARAYLNHPILGARLVECVRALLAIDGRSASQIFGFPDDKKLKSSMTLFAYVSDQDSLFHQALSRYFNGHKDDRTLQILEGGRENE